MRQGPKIQKLLPVSVPWQVSPSTPFLRVRASELPSEPTEVSFVAHFALLDAATPIVASKDVLRIYGVTVNAGREQSPYQALRVVFDNGLWIRISPSHSDHEVIDETLFDWSQVRHSLHSGQDLEACVIGFHREWQESGICPDPRMYEVQESKWVHDIGGQCRGYKHYLVLGHDAYVEVLATGWRWYSEGGVNWCTKPRNP